MNYSIAAIKKEISQLTPGRSIGRTTWKRWMALIGVKRHQRTCTYDQWVLLCAALALHIAKKRVTSLTINTFLAVNGTDPMDFIPGYLPSPGKKLLPAFTAGSELPDVLWEWIGAKPSEWTIRRWCQELGYGYGRLHTYSRSQVETLISKYIQIRRDQIERGRKLTQFKVKETRAA